MLWLEHLRGSLHGYDMISVWRQHIALSRTVRGGRAFHLQIGRRDSDLLQAGWSQSVAARACIFTMLSLGDRPSVDSTPALYKTHSAPPPHHANNETFLKPHAQMLVKQSPWGYITNSISPSLQVRLPHRLKIPPTMQTHFHPH